MSYVENEFAIRLFSSFRNYKMVQTYPMKLNASCPICGDSKSDMYKARFWYYLHKDKYLVHCFNCDYTSGFQNFLKSRDETLYREYLIERRKESMKTGEPIREEIDLTKFKSKLVFVDDLIHCHRLDKLPENHPIIKYVEKRCIPKSAYTRLYFTAEWQLLVNKYKPDTYKYPKKEFRLVIPIYNTDGKIESFQGRDLSGKSKQKYMTIKAHENASKIYGTDLVDANKNVWVMEGPIDTMFIPNSIAITGGSLNLDSVPYPDKRVWVLDNEPRHPDVKSRVYKLIEQKEKIVIWDKSPWKKKDVNDMIIFEKATSNEILSYFERNIVSGLMATFRANNWFKV